MVRISDARMSGTSYGACVLHVAPESCVGGPLALVRTGDLITLDAAARAAPGGGRRRAGRPTGAVAGARPASSAATARCSASRSLRPTRAATSTSWPATAEIPTRSETRCNSSRCDSDTWFNNNI